MFKRIIVQFLIFNMILTNSSYSQSATAPISLNSGGKEINEFSTDSSVLDNKPLNSHLMGQILKQLGEPGFYFSKFLNYRRQVSNPTCYLSQKINKLSVMTALAGEVTTHAFFYYETKKLKKKYEAKIEKIEKYRAELDSKNKLVLEYDQDAPDIQYESLFMVKEQNEIDLKKAEMNRKFVYLSLSLQLTAKIIAALEAAAESGTGGALLAKNEFCFQSKMAQQKIEEEKTRQLLAGESVTHRSTALTDYANKENEPWYVKPFQWLAGGLGVIEDSNVFQNYKDLRKGVSKEQRIRDGTTGGMNGTEANAGAVFMQVAESAAYAEEMIVDVVMDVLQKWSKGKNRQTMQDEINGINKQKIPSGLLRLIKDLRLDIVAIRYAVRSLIQANLLTVNTFMRSSAGRIATFVYNVYVIKKTIDITEAEVEYAKQKIAILDKSLKDFHEKTTKTPALHTFFDLLLPKLAFAEINNKYHFPRPPCFQEISPGCKLDLNHFLTSDTSGAYAAYPKDNQLQHKAVLDDNYALQTALMLSTGKFNYEDIDLGRTQNEIKNLDSKFKILEKSLSAHKINIIADENVYNNFKMNDQSFFPEVMLAPNGNLPSVNRAEKSIVEPAKGLETTETTLGKISSTDNEVLEAEKVAKNEVGDNNRIIFNPSSEKSEYEYEASNISKKELNLFEVISRRYYNIYFRDEN